MNYTANPESAREMLTIRFLDEFPPLFVALVCRVVRVEQAAHVLRPFVGGSDKNFGMAVRRGILDSQLTRQ